MDKLNQFKPILSLKVLKKMTADHDKADRIKEQLSWHKKVGKDVNIPPGFHAFRKTKAWVAMVRAVQRHRCGKAHQKLEGMIKCYNLNACHCSNIYRTGGD
jgi:hypothetical protein